MSQNQNQHAWTLQKISLLSKIYRVLTASCKYVMTAHAHAPTIAVTGIDESSTASTSSSNTATYAIAPDANPNPTGKSGTNFPTNMKAGMAMKGCGSEVKMAHRPVRSMLTLREVKTRATARPSGTLCTAKDKEINLPSVLPFLPPAWMDARNYMSVCVRECVRCGSR